MGQDRPANDLVTIPFRHGILFRPGDPFLSWDPFPPWRSLPALGSSSAPAPLPPWGPLRPRVSLPPWDGARFASPNPLANSEPAPGGGSFAFAARAHGGSGRRLAPMAFVASACGPAPAGDKSWASRARFSTYTDIRGCGACWHGGKGVLWLTPDQGKYDKEWTAAFGALVFPIGNVCISPKTCTRRPFSVTEPRLGGGRFELKQSVQILRDRR